MDGVGRCVDVAMDPPLSLPLSLYLSFSFFLSFFLSLPLSHYLICHKFSRSRRSAKFYPYKGSLSRNCIAYSCSVLFGGRGEEIGGDHTPIWVMYRFLATISNYFLWSVCLYIFLLLLNRRSL